MSMYSTTKLIAVTESKFKFDPLFLRLFYRESYEFDTETVDLAKIPGEVGMAVYISPTIEGKVLRSRGGLTTQFKPGYVKPKHEVNPQMVLRRLPDEDLRIRMRSIIDSHLRSITFSHRNRSPGNLTFLSF
ncbi:major capsid protein [Sodalis endosymbiont of Spalangia cameroni]|uniref:major capsid protein n=1 Tax=Sodalis praecaptivus TaxID=1239307 RepID=UPI0031FA3C59